MIVWTPNLPSNTDDLSSDDRGVPLIQPAFRNSSAGRKPSLISLSLQPYVQNNSAERKPSLISPNLQPYADDRIEQQMSFVPRSVLRRKEEGREVLVKTILLLDGGLGWGKPLGSSTFQTDSCPVSACKLVEGSSWQQRADVVLTKQGSDLPVERPPSQIWVLYMLESPYHTPLLDHLPPASFNWTATYRHDSTIVTPYEKYVPFNASLQLRDPVKNYAEGKTKMVAWFVSNCGAPNGRSQYVQELSRYIQVDIYGSCGPLTCRRSEQDQCFVLLNTDYKFYLAFENSNCRDYITEKFFINGLK